jgi:hypothetical protein
VGGLDVQVDENTGVVAEPDADTFVDAWQRADIDGLVALGGCSGSGGHRCVG